MIDFDDVSFSYDSAESAAASPVLCEACLIRS